MTSKFAVLAAVLCSLTFSFAHAASINGTVTDKTTGKPSSGDKVELVDVQAGMSVAATATTNSSGHYTLNKPGSGPYLVRVTHQGSPYFIAAPEGNAAGDIPVYDAAPSVGGISIEADVLECEAQNGQLRVFERYLVHNSSSPPRTQYDPAHGFEIVLPSDAVLDGSQASRPTGLPTSTPLKSAGAKDHYMFDFPIQPDEGEKDTQFQISYHLPYSSGKYTFKPQMLIPAEAIAFLLPKSVGFTGPGFTSIPQDPKIQTMLAKNVQPGQELTATISGDGSLPREDQGQPTGSSAGAQDAAPPGPGGGIGQPIDTPDPLSKYKWWIIIAMMFILAAVAGFMLRKPAGAAAAAGAVRVPLPASGPKSSTRPPSAAPRPQAAYAPPAPAPAAPAYAPPPAPQSHNATLLAVLKEELFAIESEKLSGDLPANEYKEQKAALETVLKRALRKASS